MSQWASYSRSKYRYEKFNSFTKNLVSWFDYGMSFADGPITWRLPLAFQIAFAITVMILLIDLPESPRFLVKSNRHEEATHVLCRFFDEPESSELVIRERQSILDAIEIDAGEGISWMSLLKNDSVKTRRRTLLAFAVMVRI